MDNARLLEVLQEENATLRDRVTFLEDALFSVDPLPLEWRLTGQEARVFGVLINRELATKDAIMAGVYGDRPDGDVAEVKIVDVFVCKMRKKLRPHGIEIATVWGQGYSLPKAVRDRHRRREASR